MLFKALVKKQLLEVNKGYFTDRKTGDRKSVKSTIAFVLFNIAIFAFLGVYIGIICKSMLTALSPYNLNWLYFSVMGTLSILLGAFGSVFNTYETLYKAEDNELLLSMPIKPIQIIASKLIGVFLSGLFYELPIAIPMLIVYWAIIGANPLTVIIQFIMIIAIALLILTISCVFGYIIAVLSTKIKSKAIVSAVATVLFIAVYYFISIKINVLLQAITENANEFGEKIKSSTFLLYNMGSALDGKFTSFLIFVAVSVALVLIVFAVLNRNFVKLATISHVDRKSNNRSKVKSAVSPKKALLKKELKRFTSSTVYLVNCGLGVIIMPIMAIFMAFNSTKLTEKLNLIVGEMISIDSLLPILIVLLICLICTINAVTAPSVSLEGKNLWLTQSLPVEASLILEAKVNLGVTINAIPSVASALILCIAFKFDVLSIVLCLSTIWLYVWLSAKLGLILNLMFPNLNWTNESLPVKQGISILLNLLFGTLISIGMFAVSFFAIKKVDVSVIMIVLVAVLIVLNILFSKWLNTKGVRIFNSL